MGGAAAADARRNGSTRVAGAEVQAAVGRAADVLRAARQVLVTTHRAPDGDGIGAATGLGLALEALGKEPTLYSADPIPLRYSFLAGISKFVDMLPAGARFDASVVVDCADLSRLGPHFPDAARRGTLVILDHHATRGRGADVYVNDETSPAAGEVALRVMKALGAPLSPEIAECLYVSLVSDTGSFRYSNTSPLAMRSAAELLETGIDPWRVSSNLYESESPERMRLLSRVLATLELSSDGRCAVLHASDAMMRESGATWDMLDGFVNHGRAIRGVEVAVLFSEREPGTQKISFRSRGNVNVAAIAEGFGGGGHFHAAGCTVEGDPAAVRERIYAAVRGALR
jgi:phosphoesterase RecJ-like protein